jgi:hypothetical protein
MGLTEGDIVVLTAKCAVEDHYMRPRMFHQHQPRDPAREVREFLRWVEDEYQVEGEWAYVPVVSLGREPRIRCCLALTPLPWNETQHIHWFICCEWPPNSPVKALEAHRLRLVSTLAIDLQMYRAYGEEACEHTLPFPPSRP